MSSIGTKLKCPDYGGVLISEGVVLCTGFNGVESGLKDVSLLERCPLLSLYSILDKFGNIRINVNMCMSHHIHVVVQV